MKTTAALLLLSLLLACTGCDLAWRNNPIYAMVAVRDLPVGHVIKESDVKTTKIGISHRESFHPFP